MELPGRHRALLAGLAVTLTVLVGAVVILVATGGPAAPGDHQPGRTPPSAQEPGEQPGEEPGVEPTPTPTHAPLEYPVLGPRYVSPIGDDAGPGSLEEPWRSPQRAVDLTVGEVVLLSGSYEPFVITRSDLLVRAADGDEVVIEGGLRLTGVERVTLAGLTIQGALGSYEGGLEIERSSRIEVRDSLIRDNTFGIHLRDSTDVRITRNEMTRNGSGVEVHGAAAGLVVSHNRMHHNDRAVDRSRGANAVVFYRSTGPAEVTRNELWSNWNPSPAPGTDPGGGAFEIYASSDITISHNRIWDSAVLETGTEDDIPCARLVFIHNLAYRGESDELQDGLILRCAEDSLVAHNTLVGLDNFAIDVIHQQGPFAGSVERLRIVNNIAVHGRAYSIDNQLPDSVVIDWNLAWNPRTSEALRGNYLAYYWRHGNTQSHEELQSWGIDPNGIGEDPRFVDAAANDYRLRPDSPALGAGVLIPGINDELQDGQPNLGYHEVDG
jgi:parallel beta-helix repeat protein